MPIDARLWHLLATVYPYPQLPVRFDWEDDFAFDDVSLDVSADAGKAVKKTFSKKAQAKLAPPKPRDRDEPSESEAPTHQVPDAYDWLPKRLAVTRDTPLGAAEAEIVARLARLAESSDMPRKAAFLGFLIPWTRHVHPAMREAAARACRGASGFLAREALGAALEDRDPAVAVAACEALLDACRDTSSAAGVLTVFHRNPAVRAAAVGFWERTGGASGPLAHALFDPVLGPRVAPLLGPDDAQRHLTLLLDLSAEGKLDPARLRGWVRETPFELVYAQLKRADTAPRPDAELDAIFAAARSPDAPARLGGRAWLPSRWDALWALVAGDREHSWADWLDNACRQLTLRISTADVGQIIAGLLLAGAAAGWGDAHAEVSPALPNLLGLVAIEGHWFSLAEWVPADRLKAVAPMLLRVAERWDAYRLDDAAMGTVLARPAAARPDGLPDLAVVAALLTLGKGKPFALAKMHLTLPRIAEAIRADPEGAVPFVTLERGEESDRQLFLRELTQGTLAGRASLTALLLVHLPGDRIDALTGSLDGRAAAAVWGELLALEAAPGPAKSLNAAKRARLVGALSRQAGPSHAAEALRLWLSRPRPSDSELGLAWLGRMAGDMEEKALCRTLRGVGPSLFRELLPAVAVCPGFPYDREVALARACERDPDPAVQAWVAARVRFDAKRKTASPVSPYPRTGLCAHFDATHVTVYPDATKCVALLACHDPDDEVSRWIGLFSEDTPEFLTRVDTLMVDLWRKETRLPLLGHAALCRWDEHADALRSRLAERGIATPEALFRRALASPPLVARLLWRAAEGWAARGLARKEFDRAALDTPAFAQLLAEALGGPLSADAARLLGRWAADPARRDTVLPVARAVAERLPRLSADARGELGTWADPVPAPPPYVAPPLPASPIDLAADQAALLDPAAPDAELEQSVRRLCQSEAGRAALLDVLRALEGDPAQAARVADRLDYWPYGDIADLWPLLEDAGSPLWMRLFVARQTLRYGDRARRETCRTLLEANLGVPGLPLAAWASGWRWVAPSHAPTGDAAEEALRSAPADAPLGHCRWAVGAALDAPGRFPDDAARTARCRELAASLFGAPAAACLLWLSEHSAGVEDTEEPLIVRAVQLPGITDAEQTALGNRLWAKTWNPLCVPLRLPRTFESGVEGYLFRRQRLTVVEAVTDGLLMTGTEGAVALAQGMLDSLDASSYEASAGFSRLAEYSDDADVRKAALRHGSRAFAREDKLRRVAEVFAWGVREGRKLLGRTYAVEMLTDGTLGYTRMNQNKIWVSPLPILQRVWNGAAIVRGLIVHEYGHHLYHKGKHEEQVWKDCHDSGIGELLNLVADEHLERNLRAIDPFYGDDLKKLGAHAFLHSRRNMEAGELLDLLGSRAFSVLTKTRLKPERDPSRVALGNGEILMAMERAGMSFLKFVKCLRLGRPNATNDPKVAAGMALFGRRFRGSTMDQLRDIAVELRRIFGEETDILKRFSQDCNLAGEEGDLEAAGEGISANDLSQAVARAVSSGDGAKPRAKRHTPPGRPRSDVTGGQDLNLSPEERFNLIENITPMSHDPADHQEIARRVARPAARMREFLAEMGFRSVAEGGRTRGRSVDRSKLRNVVLRGDPRMLIARETRVETDLFVGVVIDCSGSMYSGDKMDRAKAFGTLIAEAARGQAGIDVRLFGFTDRIIYDAGDASQCAVHTLNAGGGNNDAAALFHAAGVARQSRRKAKVLVMISDGAPTECSVTALRSLVNRLGRKGYCCAQVAVEEFDKEHVCFDDFVLATTEDFHKSVVQFGRTIKRLIGNAMRG